MLLAAAHSAPHRTEQTVTRKTQTAHASPPRRTRHGSQRPDQKTLPRPSWPAARTAAEGSAATADLLQPAVLHAPSSGAAHVLYDAYDTVFAADSVANSIAATVRHAATATTTIADRER